MKRTTKEKNRTPTAEHGNCFARVVPTSRHSSLNCSRWPQRWKKLWLRHPRLPDRRNAGKEEHGVIPSQPREIRAKVAQAPETLSCLMSVNLPHPRWLSESQTSETPSRNCVMRWQLQLITLWVSDIWWRAGILRSPTTLFYSRWHQKSPRTPEDRCHQ